MKELARTCGTATAGVLWLALAVVTFQQPHSVLPSRPRLLSPGFMALMAVSIALMLARSVWTGGGSTVPALLSWGLVLGGTALAAGTRFPAYTALIMAASIGVDLVSIALSLSGVVDLKLDSAKHLLTIWELVAAAVACIRITATTSQAAP